MRRLIVAFGCLSAVAGLLPYLLFGVFSFGVFERALLPQYEQRAEGLGEGIGRKLELGVRLFGTLEALRDVDATVATALENAPEAAFIVITDKDGAVVAQRPSIVPQIVSDDVRNETATELSAARKIEGVATRLLGWTTGNDLRVATQGLARVGDFLITQVPVRVGDDTIGYVIVGTDASLVDDLRRDLTLEMIIVYIAATILTLEFLLAIAGVSLLRPLVSLRFLEQQLRLGDLRHTAVVTGRRNLARVVVESNRFIRTVSRRLFTIGKAPESVLIQSDGRPSVWVAPSAILIRLPLILFFLAEAILRPSLPLYLADLVPMPFMSNDLSIGFAMSAFLLASIVGVILGARMSDTISVRRTMLVGIAICALGTYAHVLAESVVQATSFRAIAGFGYGVVYAAAQVFIVGNSDAARRTSSLSILFIAVVGADVAGPSIGGIVADRLGTDGAFITATGVLILSSIATFFALPSLAPVKNDALNIASRAKGVTKAMMSNRRFMVLTLGLAVPAKLLLNGALFLCVPLAVVATGAGATEAGRLLMIYGIVVLLSAGAIAQTVDRWKMTLFAVCFGTLLSAAVLVIPALFGGTPALVVAVVMFAFGQSLSVPSQFNLVLSLSPTEQANFGTGAVIGVFRTIERLGSFAGPIIAAALLSFATPIDAMLGLGLIAVVLSTAATTYFMIFGERNEEEAIDAMLVHPHP